MSKLRSTIGKENSAKNARKLLLVYCNCKTEDMNQCLPGESAGKPMFKVGTVLYTERTVCTVLIVTVLYVLSIQL